ncbi:MAG: YdcF family protein [Magnetospirillum sp.]|nr:YdcF family protein [Magnetospirillum sp.]
MSGRRASRRAALRRIAAGLLGVLAGVVLAWAGGLVWFAALVADAAPDLDTRTDAIVVLTGGSERVTTGLVLLEARLADRLFISGVHRGVEVHDLLRQSHVALPEVETVIELGYAADDTVGNAAETAAFMAKARLGSLRLVTAGYHMPRSLLEFRRALPHATIIPHPVFPDAVKSRQWWRWPGTAALFATEYSKYLAAIARHWLLPRTQSP